MHERTNIQLSRADRSKLKAVVANRNSPQKHVWRAKIVLLTADGRGTAEIMQATGKAKTVGAGVLAWGIPERWMPAAAGGMFLVPLVGFVWMLSRIPPPTDQDVAARAERPPLSSADRGRWIRRHGVGLGLIILAYLVVTVLRSLRADFAPELWRALGSAGVPEVFTRSEWWVMLGVVAASGGAIWVKDHRRAISLSLGTGLGGLGLVAYALTAWPRGDLSPFGFMVLAGLGLYLPYVAIHTTVFERLIALTRERGNRGYLMYLADAAGYLGYVGVMLARNSVNPESGFLEFFRTSAWMASGVGALSLAGAWWVFIGRAESIGDRVRLEAGQGRGDTATAPPRQS